MDLTTRPLGSSDMRITPVGVGTGPIGSGRDWRIYWGEQDDRDSIRAIHEALDAGVNWIDTAPFYGWGRAEEVVGRAIRDRRDRVYVFTKCGTLNDGSGGWVNNLQPGSIRREVEQSLRRLGVDRIDLMQFHDPDPETPIEASWQELQRLIDEGKVRFGALSNHPVELIERAHTIAPVVSNQHRYNLLDRSIERDVLPYSRDHGMGVLTWSSLAEGFLTDDFDIDRLDPNDFRRTRKEWQEPRYAKVRTLVDRLREIARDHGRTATELSLAWLVAQPGVTGAIVGIRNEREAGEMVSAGSWELPRDVVERVDELSASWEA